MLELNQVAHQAWRRGEKDRRVKQLSITVEGTRLELALTGAQMEQLHSVFEAAGPKAERAWREVMQRLAKEA